MTLYTHTHPPPKKSNYNEKKVNEYPKNINLKNILRKILQEKKKKVTNNFYYFPIVLKLFLKQFINNYLKDTHN